MIYICLIFTKSSKYMTIRRIFFLGIATLFATSVLAESEGVDMTPPAPVEPENEPPIPRIPARAPQVTITDGSLLTVDRVAADASLIIEILRDGESIFSTFTMDHSIAIPMLDGPHTYTILLTVNGTLWTGTYIP